MFSRTLFFIFSLATALYSSEYAVVVNIDSPIEKINQKELRNLYLRRQNFIEDEKIIPVNTLASNEARLKFEQYILNMGRDKLNEYWIKQHFRGVTPPSTVASFEAALVFLNHVKGSIAYIPKEMITKNINVKVIYEY